MECAICHRQEPSKTRCVQGHYVCNDCHTKGMDSLFGLCLTETSADPVNILERMMDLPFCHMHGPEHHVMVGAALLTAYKNAGEGSSLSRPCTKCTAGENRCLAGPAASGAPAGRESARGSSWPSPQSPPPGGGALGAEQPDDRESPGGHWPAGRPPVLQAGFLSLPPCGHRLCPGPSGVEMDRTQPRCRRSDQNNQCLKTKCPFYTNG